MPQKQYVYPNNYLNTSQNLDLRRSRSFVSPQKQYVPQKNWVYQNNYLNASQNPGILRRSKSYDDIRYKNLGKSNLDDVRSLGNGYVQDL